MATTLDGKIGKDSDHFPDWTGSEDKKNFVKITKDSGVIIMGSKTFDTIKKPLPGRKNIVMTRDKNKISKWEDLEYTNDSPEKIIENLKKQNYKKVILAGGTTINTIFAKKKLIDEIIITVCPKIFGTGLALFDESISMNLKLKKIEKLEKNTISLHYKCKNTNYNKNKN